MELLDYPPSPPLKRVVERYWASGDGALPGPTPPLAVMPSPIQTVLVVLPPPSASNGTAPPSPTITLAIGPVMHRQQGLHYTPPPGIFGVLFQPCGFYQLLGVSPADAATSLAEPDSPASRFGLVLARHVAAAGTGAQRVAAAEALMLDELRRREPQVAAIEGLLELVAQCNGQLNVDEMAQEVNLSRRQLERRFRNVVGVPPKLYAEMHRFAHVFQLIHEQRLTNWSDVTHACGYFDQAHFIREFRRFTGETPGAYFSQPMVASSIR